MSMNPNGYYLYILTSKGGTLYIGMTNNLKRRVWEHKNKVVAGFTQRYDVNWLVYYEGYGEAKQALAREKQLKGWVRRRKLALINDMNPTWRDLSDDWNE